MYERRKPKQPASVRPSERQTWLACLPIVGTSHPTSFANGQVSLGERPALPAVDSDPEGPHSVASCGVSSHGDRHALHGEHFRTELDRSNTAKHFHKTTPSLPLLLTYFLWELVLGVTAICCYKETLVLSLPWTEVTIGLRKHSSERLVTCESLRAIWLGKGWDLGPPHALTPPAREACPWPSCSVPGFYPGSMESDEFLLSSHKCKLQLLKGHHQNRTELL